MPRRKTAPAATPPRVVISSTQRAIRVPRKLLMELPAFVAAGEGVRLAEVDLAIVASGEMAGLNQRYLRHSGPTDVLSFELESTPQGMSVQLVVCGDVAASQGPAHGQSATRELLLYVVHGLLHVMGYEDHSIRGAARMHAREDELLSEFLARYARPKRR